MPRLKRRPLFLYLATGALALAVFALAWPRLLAALHFLPVEAAIDRYHLDGEPPLESIDTLLEQARRSVERHPQPHYWSGLAVLSYLQALDRGASLATRREAFERVTEAARESLLLAPVQPRTWLYLALAQGSLSFRGTDAIESFKMSVYTGRVEPALLISRLQLAYGRFGQLDEEARGLLLDQTLLAWQLKQRDFVRALNNGAIDFQLVSSLLATAAPGVLQEMEAALGETVR